MKYLTSIVISMLSLAYGMLAACGGSCTYSSHSYSTTISTPAKDGSKATADSKNWSKSEKQWETDTSLRTPESVLWNAEKKILYVSNIDGGAAERDGNGFISQLTDDGRIANLHWVGGLDAPKGMGLYQGELYIADLDSLVIVDINAAKIKTKIFVPGAVFLNDVAVDSVGNVYISDTRKGKIFQYKEGKVSVFLSSPEVKDANGLLVWKGKLWIDAAGGIYQYDFASQKIRLFCDQVKGGDGLTVVNDSDLIASRWAGEVYYVHADGSAEKMLDTQASGENTADIYFLRERNILLVPTFKGNRVVAYKL